MSEAHPFQKDPNPGDPVTDERVQLAKMFVYLVKPPSDAESAGKPLTAAATERRDNYLLDATENLRSYANEYPPSEEWNVDDGPISLFEYLTQQNEPGIDKKVRDVVMDVYVQTGKCEKAALRYARNDGQTLARVLTDRARKSGTTGLAAEAIRDTRERWGSSLVRHMMSLVTARERQQATYQREFDRLLQMDYVLQANQFASLMAETDPLMYLDAARCAIARGDEKATRGAAEGVRKALQVGRMLSEELDKRLKELAEGMLVSLAQPGNRQPSLSPARSSGSRTRRDDVLFERREFERRERCAIQFLSIVGSQYPEAHRIATTYYADNHRYPEAVRHLTGFENAMKSRKHEMSQEDFDGLVADLVSQACAYYQTEGGGSMSPTKAELFASGMFRLIDPESEPRLSTHPHGTDRPGSAEVLRASDQSPTVDPLMVSGIRADVLAFR